MDGAIAMRVTGRGVGAIAVIVVEGAGAAAVVARMAERAKEMAVGRVLHADIVHPASGEVLDDAVVVRAGEERFELQVHGGVAVVEAVLKGLEAAGAQVVEEIGEGIEAEVERALPLALTITGARLVASQVEEGLGAFVREWIFKMEGGGGEELWRLQSAVQWVLLRSERLRLLLEPARVAIVGAPNVGKSTLANALLGRTASITSDVAGTTRDWVESACVFVSEKQAVQVPVVLVDTAGVRETGDALERVAIERTHEQVGAADAVVVVMDGSRAVTAEEMRMVEGYRGGTIPCVVVVNKADLAGTGMEGAVQVSALRGEGLDRLMAAVLGKLDLLAVGEGEVFAFTERQRELLRRAAMEAGVEEAAGLLCGLVEGDKVPG